MSWTGWLIVAVAVVGVCVIAIQFFPELFHISGKLLDRLSPKRGLVILGAVIVACLLAGMIVVRGR